MKKRVIVLILLVVLVGAVFLYNNFTGETTYEGNEVVLYEFWGDGCPHCASLNLFLDKMKGKYPSLVIKKYEVWYNEGNKKIMQDMANAYDVEVKGVPAVFINDRFMAGFSTSIGEEIEREIQKCLVSECINSGDKL
jgi:thiol-disulfide isomerase/thioredoxin